MSSTNMPRLAALPRLARQMFGIQFALGICVYFVFDSWLHKKLKSSNGCYFVRNGAAPFTKSPPSPVSSLPGRGFFWPHSLVSKRVIRQSSHGYFQKRWERFPLSLGGEGWGGWSFNKLYQRPWWRFHNRKQIFKTRRSKCLALNSRCEFHAGFVFYPWSGKKLK